MSILAFILSCILVIFTGCMDNEDINDMAGNNLIKLPPPSHTGQISVEEALLKRRSVRSYAGNKLSISEISQLLWAAQGINDKTSGFRTAPSAGATFPIELYALFSNVEGVPDGVYRYDVREHAIRMVIRGDLRRDLAGAALRQSSITEAHVVLVITAVRERTEQRYGDRAVRYIHMEAGHVAQNVYLQGVALGIGTVVIGAFSDEAVAGVLSLEGGEYPLYIMPLGRIN